MAQTFRSYIRTCRRACALTQDELAYLLGLSRGATVCKLEHGRAPDHFTTLAYLALFNASPRALFAGTFAEVEQRVRKRARILKERLQRKLQKRPNDRVLKHKVEMLEVLLAGTSVLPPSL